VASAFLESNIEQRDLVSITLVSFSLNLSPAIPVKKWAIDILKHPRSEEARKQKDFDRWKDEKEYGMRWMVETAYSAFKR